MVRLLWTCAAGAAIAAIAPAAFLMNENRNEILKPIREPVFVVQGDADKQVPVTNTRMWVDSMKELKPNYEYKEIPGADHGTVIEQGMPALFAFFNNHVRK